MKLSRGAISPQTKLNFRHQIYQKKKKVAKSILKKFSFFFEKPSTRAGTPETAFSPKDLLSSRDKREREKPPMTAASPVREFLQTPPAEIYAVGSPTKSLP